MAARRVITVTLLVSALAVLPTQSFADTYPPQVEPSEVVTDDATPPVTDVLGDQIVVPAVDALSATGAGVLPVALVALALLVVGGGLATLSQRRRSNSTI